MKLPDELRKEVEQLPLDTEGGTLAAYALALKAAELTLEWATEKVCALCGNRGCPPWCECGGKRITRAEWIGNRKYHSLSEYHYWNFK